MTNATAENNATNFEQIYKVTCNQTANSDNQTQSCVDATITQNNYISNNTNSNATSENELQDSETITTTELNDTNRTEENQVIDNNTVLKYVYKKGDKAEIPLKNKGHFKNSLRRKRSTSDLYDKSPLPSKFQKPVVVNYETVHGSGEISAPLKNTRNNILGANLADFNIQTRHLNPDTKKDENAAPLKKDSSEVESLNEGSNERGDIQKYDNNRSNRESEESSERGDYKNGKHQQEKVNSDERGNYHNRKSSRENGDSSERVNYKNRDSSRREENSDESGAYKNRDSSYERGESGESDSHKNGESIGSRDDSSERGKYKSRRNGSGNTYNSAESHENSRANSRYSAPNRNKKIERDDSGESKKSDYNSSESKESIEADDRDSKRKNTHSSNERSDESNVSIERNKPQQSYKSDPKLEINKNSPGPLRNIDLGDFNYERVHVNNDGKVVPQKDNLEYADPNSAVEILPLSTAAPVAETNNPETINSSPDVNTLASPEVGNNDNKLVHIDDGEVKPVVEINPESEPVSEEVESLESVLGVNQPENDQKNKIVEQTEAQQGDVKQQFERIPVNYNHAAKTENKDTQTTETPKEDKEPKQGDGTIDVIAPQDHKYDEHLNVKFDDLTIKLPEIKLPDDILAYTKEDSPFIYEEDQEKKQPGAPSYYYDRDDKENLRQEKSKKKDEDSVEDDDSAPDLGYYGYYGDSEKKQNYKNEDAEASKEESDEDDDLYEKFVRARFGKQGTFEKRSEKLRASAPKNPELYKTLKNILKKTADIDEQAKKSGDPNAGYMWTLEYGEKL